MDIDFYPVPKGSDNFTYLSHRIRQTHDIWHVLTGYTTSVSDELALQAFSLAQLHSAVSAILVGAAFVKTSFEFPERIPDLMQTIFAGWQLGLKARPLLGQNWEERWDEPLDHLRRENESGLGVTKNGVVNQIDVLKR